MKYLAHEVPVLVCDCIAFIRARGLHEKGLFRKPGKREFVVQLLKEYYKRFPDLQSYSQNSYSVLNNNPLVSVRDVCSLLKMFLCDLNDKIICEETRKRFCRVLAKAKGESKERRGKLLSEVVREMEDMHGGCLSFVVEFLREIVKHEKVNGMSGDKLAICFAIPLMGGGVDVKDAVGRVDILRRLLEVEVELVMVSGEVVVENTKFTNDTSKERLAQETIARSGLF